MLSVSCTPCPCHRPEYCRTYDSLFAGFANSRLTTRGDRRGLVINDSSSTLPTGMEVLCICRKVFPQLVDYSSYMMSSQ